MKLQAITLMFQWQNRPFDGRSTLWDHISVSGAPVSRRHSPGDSFVSSWSPVPGLVFGVPLQMLQLRRFITAILVNTPGDASNAATILDGYPMCEKGKGGVALSISATAALVGGILGTLCLIYTAPLLAEFALKFGPAEYFLTAILALSVIAAVVQGATQGLISAASV
jgi:hypothetical protein